MCNIRIRLLIILASCFFLVTCQKLKISNATQEDEEQLSSKEFSPQFNWKSSRIIQFSISSDKPQIINITSEDKEITFHRGNLFDVKNGYNIEISVPCCVEEIRVNDNVVSLSSNTININLSTQKTANSHEKNSIAATNN